MIWEIDEEEVRELFALPAEDRAIQFFQLVADWEAAWGLRDGEDWLVDKKTDALPLWPHGALAEACARGPWSGTSAKPIPLDDLLIDLLPLLASDHLRVAVFPSPDDPGLLLTPTELGERLESELAIGGEGD
jgi:hypothetical protein